MTDVKPFEVPLSQKDSEYLIEQVNQILTRSDDLYTRLNAVRDWMNERFPDFELYLEDVWNDNVDGETHFEYILRSRVTLDETRALAYDVYLNHQDKGGVWHLGDYQHSVLVMETPQEMIDFIQTNF